jgi:hypothetical protein
MSLPGVLGTATVADIPAEVPYLSASAAAIARWRERLSAVPGRRVGIVWQGNPTHLNDAFRSTPLRNFAPLAKIAGVTLVCLQKHVGIEQLEQVPFNVHPLGADWDEVGGPFMDTVAVMKNLDLVITIDTVAAHMAGALGVPVWVALSTCPDWRWFENRDDSPWYPTMRLFRQTQPGDWAGVFARMAAELQRLVDAG